MSFNKLLVALALCAASNTYAQTPQTPKTQSPQQDTRTQKEKDIMWISHERDSAKAVTQGKKFLEDYPLASVDFKNDQSWRDYWRVYLNIINHATNRDSAIAYYFKDLPYYTVLDLYHHGVEVYVVNKLDSSAHLYERSRLLIKKLDETRVTKPIEFFEKSDSEWTIMGNRNYYGDLLIHIHILRDLHKNEDGLKYASDAIQNYGYKISSLNEDYVTFLQAVGQKEKLEQALEASVHENQASPLMLDMLKKNYIAKNKDDKGFDAYVEGLKSKEAQVALAEELQRSMVKKPFKSFSLYDNHGKLVDTKDWKGKVVVVDFFASWCAPCKASFPGMKMAQERFKDDKDVLFYFIDTEEHDAVKGKEYVLKFIKDNDFPFTILFDKESKEKGGTFTNDFVAKLLGVTGIPRKMILDKEGNVRFDMDGYYGSPTKLADEVTIMVNLAKKSTDVKATVASKSN